VVNTKSCAVQHGTDGLKRDSEKGRNY